MAKFIAVLNDDFDDPDGWLASREADSVEEIRNDPGCDGPFQVLKHADDEIVGTVTLDCGDAQIIARGR